MQDLKDFARNSYNVYGDAEFDVVYAEIGKDRGLEGYG
jgi:hypothetical protein